ncbi:hypothetical protein OVA14_07200 [Agrococcus sp. SL85]|uniref:hypothetical protein n=1 Tax=Agrococcus sp. SL85 TaxID=2995141 RepID=UPI00226CCD6E|nr:hypothetical protein [Agrococcus sp. SL85]WAC65179.1 hypothetical protein OVA14_07200 [Agrococcus sp. SL85]
MAAMAYADFATPDQMEKRSQGAITAATHPFLEQELAAASRAIRDHCGWHIAEREAITLRHRGPFTSRLWLPAMEVASIDTATVDDVTYDVATVDFDPDTGWTSLVGRRWDVTYTAGHEDVPETITTLALHIAARALGSPLGITREQAGAVSVGHTLVAPGASGGTAILPHEAEQLAPYRIGALP